MFCNAGWQLTKIVVLYFRSCNFYTD